MDKMRGMIKGCAQGRVSRSKYISPTNYADISCLGACIFSSNPSFPEDPGYRSKFIYITYTANDRFWSMEEQTEFNGFISRGLKHLKVLGDFVATTILDNPSILLKEKKEDCNWKETATQILKMFYECAGLQVPKWVGLFVKEINTTIAAIEDARESAYFQLVGMFQQNIIDGYRKDPIPTWDPVTQTHKEISFDEMLQHCLKKHLVAYLWTRPKDRDNLGWVVVTSEVMNEVKRRKIPNITSMQALVEEMGTEFRFNRIRISNDGKQKRAIYGLYGQFKNFIQPEITTIEDDEEEPKK